MANKLIRWFKRNRTGALIGLAGALILLFYLSQVPTFSPIPRPQDCSTDNDCVFPKLIWSCNDPFYKKELVYETGYCFEGKCDWISYTPPYCSPIFKFIAQNRLWIFPILGLILGAFIQSLLRGRK